MSLSHIPLAGMIVGIVAGLGSTACLVANRAMEFFPRSSSPAAFHASIAPSVPIERPRSDTNPTLIAEMNLRTKIEWLESGQDFLRSHSGYTARFEKLEAVDGTLLDPQTIHIKCRHEPFSVYLSWEKGDVGREVLYIDGENNGKLLAHDGGWKARLPAISLHPECSLAMRDARYPVTAAGILGLVNIMLETHRHDLNTTNYSSCEQTSETTSYGRPGVLFTTRYLSPALSPKYRKSVTVFDEEWMIPVVTKHYEWPSQGWRGSEQEADEATLIESYQFDEIALDYQPQALDFSRENPEYNFQ